MKKVLNVLIAVYIAAGIAAGAWIVLGINEEAAQEVQTEESAEVDNIRELVNNDTGASHTDIGTNSDAEESAEEETNEETEIASDSDLETDSDLDTDSETLTAEEEEELAALEAQLDAYDAAARGEEEEEDLDEEDDDEDDLTDDTSVGSKTTGTSYAEDADALFAFTVKSPVTLRGEATQYSTFIESLATGTTGVVLELTNDNWCKVRVDDGQEGYTSRAYIEMTALD